MGAYGVRGDQREIAVRIGWSDERGYVWELDFTEQALDEASIEHVTRLPQQGPTRTISPRTREVPGHGYGDEANQALANRRKEIQEHLSRKYAAEQGIGEEEALEEGMEEKSKEFVEKGVEVYAKA